MNTFELIELFLRIDNIKKVFIQHKQPKNVINKVNKLYSFIILRYYQDKIKEH